MTEVFADGGVDGEWETDVHGCVRDSAEDEGGTSNVVAYVMLLAV